VTVATVDRAVSDTIVSTGPLLPSHRQRGLVQTPEAPGVPRNGNKQVERYANNVEAFDLRV
jgi:hypothetical protein